jgi:hypothetical protein
MSSTFAALFSSLALAVSSAQAANVYVFSTGNTAVDSAYSAALAARGHAVTIGVQWNAFDGSVNLAGFNAVFMNMSANWSNSAGQVSLAGQQQLVNFVNAGGGLITTEWIIYNNGTSGGTAYATLMPILPATYGSTWNSASQTTFSQVTPDPIMNADLPSSFLINNNSFAGGTETRLFARPGATVFYQSSNMSSTGIVNAGLSGWGVGGGRVVSISNMPGLTSLNETNYRTLLGNAVNWVSIPSPGAIGVLGLAGLLAARRRR